jgi:hypothetical protein
MLDQSELCEFVGKCHQALDQEVLSPILQCVCTPCDEMSLITCFKPKSIMVGVVWTGVLIARVQYPTKIVATRCSDSSRFETDSVEAFLRWCRDFMPIDLDECEECGFDLAEVKACVAAQSQ